MSARYVRSIQNKHLLEFFSFLSNNRRKIGNARSGTEIVNPCINYKIYFIERYRNLGGQSNLKIFYRVHTGASRIKLYLKILKMLGSSLVVFYFIFVFIYISFYMLTPSRLEIIFFLFVASQNAISNKSIYRTRK